jgi:hypothetical protein
MAQQESTSTEKTYVKVSIVRLPMHIVCLRHLVPTYLAPSAPRTTVGLDTAGLAAVTREVYWFVLSRELEAAVNHFCRVRRLEPVCPSKFADGDYAYLIGSVLDIVSVRVFESYTSPLVFHAKCATEIASSPWNPARVGFFLAFSLSYRTLNAMHALEALLAKISLYTQTLY